MTIIGCKSPGCACNLPSSGGRIQGRGSGANTRRSCGEVWLILGMLLCLKKNNMEQTMKIQSNVWKYFWKKIWTTMENQQESVGNSFPLMAKNGGLVSSHFGTWQGWSGPRHFPQHPGGRNKGHHGAPWGTINHRRFSSSCRNSTRWMERFGPWTRPRCKSGEMKFWILEYSNLYNRRKGLL